MTACTLLPAGAQVRAEASATSWGRTRGRTTRWCTRLGPYDNGGYSPDPSLLLREVRREAQDRMFQLYPDDPRVARARAARAAEDGDWVSARNLPWAHGMGGAHS
jgi:hypothetical protein